MTIAAKMDTMAVHNSQGQPFKRNAVRSTPYPCNNHMKTLSAIVVAHISFRVHFERPSHLMGVVHVQMLDWSISTSRLPVAHHTSTGTPDGTNREAQWKQLLFRQKNRMGSTRNTHLQYIGITTTQEQPTLASRRGRQPHRPNDGT